MENRLPLGQERGREGGRCSRPEFAGGAGAAPPGVQDCALLRPGGTSRVRFQSGLRIPR